MLTAIDTRQMLFPGFREPVDAGKAFEAIRSRINEDTSIIKDLYRFELGSYGSSSRGSCYWNISLAFFRGDATETGAYSNVRFSGNIKIAGQYPDRDASDEIWPATPISVRIGGDSKRFATLAEACEFIFAEPSNGFETLTSSQSRAT